jgi:large repetitive protein
LFENLASSNYTITVRNSEGCLSAASAVIETAPLAPETPVLATVDPTCIVATGSIEVTSPVGAGFEYSIDGTAFQVSALFENLVPATYTVTVRNSEGCVSSASAVIEVAPLAPETPVLATVDPTCIVATGSIEVTSPVGVGYEYSIDGTAFQSSALFENLVPATYTVTVRNSEGCISSASAVIEVAPYLPETPVLATLATQLMYCVATGSIEVTSPVGAVGYEYSIDGTDFQSSVLFENLASGNYTVTVRNSEGCISSASAVIETAPLSPETPVLATVDPTCFVATGSIEVSSPVGAGFEYSIDGTAFQVSALFENLVPATYTVTVRNSEGCISSASAVIEVAPLAPETPVLATVNPTCIVATGSIEVTSPVGSGYEYSINGIDFQASALFENLVPANYTVTVRNSEGCISSASAVIEVAPLAPETPVLATVDPTCIVATGSIEVTSPVGVVMNTALTASIPGFGSV